jgi:hypothetical protein
MLLTERSQVRFTLRPSNFFQFLYSFQLHYGPRDDSASNINEYQKIFLGSKARSARKAENLAIFLAFCLENVGFPMPYNTMSMHGLLQEYFTAFLLGCTTIIVQKHYNCVNGTLITNFVFTFVSQLFEKCGIPRHLSTL